jgi:cytochrome c553
MVVAAGLRAGGHFVMFHVDLTQSAGQAEKIQLCAVCHGDDDNSKIEKIPSLAGQPAFFVLDQLFLMREGVRKVEAMAPIVKDSKDDDPEHSVAAFRQA